MSEWISVEDRLPANRDNVLVYGYGEYMLAWCALTDKRWSKIDECISYDRGRDSSVGHVTHWQPLPEPP